MILEVFITIDPMVWMIKACERDRKQGEEEGETPNEARSKPKWSERETDLKLTALRFLRFILIYSYCRDRDTDVGKRLLLTE